MADEPPDGLPGWTLGGVRKHGMKLEAACKTDGCGQFVIFDLERLIAQFGEDYPLPESGPAITCEQCGGGMKYQLAVYHSDDGEPEG